MLAVGAAVISSGLTMGLEAGASPPKAPVMSTKTFYACIEGGEIIGVEAMLFTPSSAPAIRARSWLRSLGPKVLRVSRERKASRARRAQRAQRVCRVRRAARGLGGPKD